MSANSNKQLAEQAMRCAREAYRAGMMGEIIPHLRQAVAHSRFHVEANAHLGWIGTDQGEYRAAFGAYCRLLLKRPWTVSAYCRLAQCAAYLGRRQLDRLSVRIPHISEIRRCWRDILEAIDRLLARRIEARRGGTPVISHWLRHYRKISRHIPINAYEYYKIAEIQFAGRCIDPRYIESSGPDRPVSSRQNEDRVVVDIGCGRTGFPSFLSSMGYRVVGVDLDRDALVDAQQAIINSYSFDLHLLMADFTQLPFRTSSLDSVTMISTIEHIPDDGDIRAIRAISDYLKPSGDLVITVPVAAQAGEHWTPHGIGHVYSDSVDQRSQGYVRVYDPASLHTRLIEPSGLELIRLAYIGEQSSLGWIGFGRNYISAAGEIIPSVFAASLCLLLSREFTEDRLNRLHWSVACIHLRKPDE